MVDPEGEEKGESVYHVLTTDPVSASEGLSSESPMVGRPEMLAKHPELRTIYEAAEASFPVRVTRSWWNRINHNDPNDPLAKQVLPAKEELEAAEGDLDDPVGEQGLSPVPWLVQKHADRALLLLTKRCNVYCRYCFRRTFDPGERADPTPEELDRAIEAAIASGAREVILSGGDPLAVRDDKLFAVIDKLRAGGVELIRIHTRTPIAYPDRVTDALVAGLRARRPLWVVVHANHARELSEDVDVALARMVDAGLPVLNQSVLLAGVNDDVDVLEALCVALVKRSIKPYYLHHTDAVTGTADFRVPLEKGLALHESLRLRVSGVALPRYVIDPPDGSGKIDVLRWWGDGHATSR